PPETLLPRDIAIGNGSMLGAFDSRYRLRELYYPYVGQENHTLGYPFRFGVWVDGLLAWIDEPSWEISLQYETDTLVTEVRCLNIDLGLALICRDCVDFDLNIYLRRIEIENLRTTPRDVRLFFHHDFHVGGSSEANTAYYHPGERALIHYKGSRWFLVNGMT